MLTFKISSSHEKGPLFNSSICGIKENKTLNYTFEYNKQSCLINDYFIKIILIKETYFSNDKRKKLDSSIAPSKCFLLVTPSMNDKIIHRIEISCN